jgi:hypothetical protein
MSDGELAAVFRGLAEDAGEAGGEIAESIAKFTDDTAAIEDANVDRTLAADAENARAANAIGKTANPESGSTGVKSDFAGRLDDGEANSEIDSFISRARNIEPRLTNDMVEISESVPGSELAGLEFRLKAEDSLQRKVATDLLENPNMSTEEALSQIKDSVRYTMKIPDNGYVDGVNEAVSRLQANEYGNVSWKNTWGSDGYQGINSAWRDPTSGQVFEVQFHTPDSFDAKMVTHDLYEQIRLPGTPPGVREELIQQQSQIFAGIPIPPGLTLLRQP